MKTTPFQLLAQRRFAPFFSLLIAGAMNDNVFKFAFVVLATYRLQVDWLPPAHANILISALFILPFFLISATAGQLADKYSKSAVVRWVKTLEIAIVCVGAVGLLTQNPIVLLLTTFCMGAQSALFGPVKYSYLPVVLHKQELVGGNALVEGGTFLAILIGQVVGGYLIDLDHSASGGLGSEGTYYVVATCFALAILGRVAAQFVPPTPAADPQLQIDLNPVRAIWTMMRLPWGNPIVFRSILGVSWLLFMGAFCITLFPVFAKEVLYGSSGVALLLLVAFSVGIAIGSLISGMVAAKHVSDDSVESGIKPIWVLVGAVILSIFALDLYFASRGLPVYEDLREVDAILADKRNWRVLFDLTLMSVGAGIYSVPLYALVQERSAEQERARIIAAGNIYDALFILASAISVAVLLTLGFSMPQMFAVLAVANICFVLLVLRPVFKA